MLNRIFQVNAKKIPRAKSITSSEGLQYSSRPLKSTSFRRQCKRNTLEWKKQNTGRTQQSKFPPPKIILLNVKWNSTCFSESLIVQDTRLKQNAWKYYHLEFFFLLWGKNKCPIYFPCCIYKDYLYLCVGSLCRLLREKYLWLFCQLNWIYTDCSFGPIMLHNICMAFHFRHSRK